MGQTLLTTHGPLPLPAFLPDATRGVVRCLDATDLAACHVAGLVVNTLHLSHHPGTTVVARVGGIHRYMGWSGPVVSDSGGFQVFSLAQQSSDLVRVTNRGMQYRREPRDDKHILTPEKCIQQQFDLGTDVMFCLDYCTHQRAPDDVQRRSIDLTVTWARRCKEEFDRRLQRHTAAVHPLLFAVVQGGDAPELRRRCADELLGIGFDGYGFGGWPVEDDGQLVDMVGFVAELLPADAPKHALGIGKPENLLAAHHHGYALFDCVLPTRDARHGRLYVFQPGWVSACRQGRALYDFVYIKDEAHLADVNPIDPTCDCLACRRYSRAYLNHLFRIKDTTWQRLATIHNLRFYSRLLECLGGAPDERLLRPASQEDRP
jgi:queuine tRNA-ribosyltransferase